MIRLVTLTALALAILSTTQALAGQNGALTLPLENHDSGGEVTSAIFDDIALRASQENSTIIVLSRVGAREHARFNYRRLHNALYRLTEYYGTRGPRPKVIGAIGERTNGAGVVEVYLAGRLHYRITFRRNRDFTVDCCWLPDEPLPREYFPYYRGKPKFKFP